MSRTTSLIAAVALAFTIAAPGLAQMSSGNTSSPSSMNMSAGHNKTMAKHKTMGHGAMMKKKSSKKMMKSGSHM